ncbi:App1 family protein [Microterricola pindariensis]|uniref:ACP synthase n=1 Tax=Microterricola pindariensis TaxID=478010 RepID=A0ABX5AQM4_9MICO|nr:phosphatase domain-containing protein [Microterricola pindariensis]PPL14280.1 ACP synthase [Microterricola pindariensis]
MVDSSEACNAPQSSAPPAHRAARIEDWAHARRDRAARKRGHRETVIPYSGYGGDGWVRILCRVLLSRPAEPQPASARARRRAERRGAGMRGWRSFTSVPVGYARVSVDVGGQSFELVADRGGVVDTVVQVGLTPGWHTATLRTAESAAVEAPLNVVDPAVTFGVLSDVDDTVMVTMLPRPLLAAWNTFVLDEHARIPTPGMAVLLDKLANSRPGTPVIYLSTGAWNVAPTLTRFLSRNLYPSGVLLLTDWGPTHDRLFRSGREHKRDNLNRLAAEFPNIRWLLVGDDGQHDEEHYRQFALAHPDNVAAIAIRELSPGEAVLAGGRSKIEDGYGGVPWAYAPDGSGLADQLTELGILKP